MYSYEDRIRAVRLYIKLGKRLRATIRQLGDLTKNSLIGWYREYEQSRDLQVGFGDTRPNPTMQTLGSMSTVAGNPQGRGYRSGLGYRTPSQVVANEARSACVESVWTNSSPAFGDPVLPRRMSAR
jgi:transposase-like protein